MDCDTTASSGGWHNYLTEQAGWPWQWAIYVFLVVYDSA